MAFARRFYEQPDLPTAHVLLESATRLAGEDTALLKEVAQLVDQYQDQSWFQALRASRTALAQENLPPCHDQEKLSGGIVSEAPPQISVVLPTDNRPELLARCLEGFAQQTLPADQFEVIVADDGSQPPVPSVGESFAGRLVVPTEGINLLGFVPDLKSFYGTARFAICPQIGATGQQVKIAEDVFAQSLEKLIDKSHERRQLRIQSPRKSPSGSAPLVWLAPWRNPSGYCSEAVAYRATFSADDDVCLVIKDFGGNSFYAGQTCATAIKGHHVRRHWTWKQSAQTIQQRVQVLVKMSPIAKPKSVSPPVSISRTTPSKLVSIELPTTALIGRLKIGFELLPKRHLAAAWKAGLAALRQRP